MQILESLIKVLDVISDGEHVGDSFCSESRVLAALRVVGYFLLIAKVAIPIIIVILGTLDLFKAVQGGDTSSASKAGKALGIRVAVGIVVFFIPTILDAIFSMSDSYKNMTGDFYSCSICLLKPSSCENGAVPTGTTIDGSEETTKKYEPSNGSCNTTALSECGNYSSCTVYDGKCEKKCSLYSMSECPSSRCEVNNGKCANK